MRVYPLLCAALIFSTSLLDFVKTQTTTTTTENGTTSSTSDGSNTTTLAESSDSTNNTPAYYPSTSSVNLTDSTSTANETISTNSADMTSSTSSANVTNSTSYADMMSSTSSATETDTSSSATSSGDEANMTSTPHITVNASQQTTNTETPDTTSSSEMMTTASQPTETTSDGATSPTSTGSPESASTTSLPTSSSEETTPTPTFTSGLPPAEDINLKGATVTSIAIGTSVAVILIIIIFVAAVCLARRKRQRRDSTASILTSGSGLRNTGTYRVSAFENMMADPHCVIELDDTRTSSNGSTFNPDNHDNPNNHDDHGPGDELPSPLNPSVPGDHSPPRNNSVEDLELPPKHETMRVMSFGNDDGMQPRSWIDTAMGNSDGFVTEHPGVGEKSHDGGERGDGMIGDTGENPDPANDEARDGATEEDDPECDYVSPSSLPAFLSNGQDKDDAGLGANDEQGKADDFPDPFPPLPTFDNDRSSC